MSKHFKRGSAVATVTAAAAGTYGAAVASAGGGGTSTPGGGLADLLTFIIDLVLDILGIPGNTLGSLFGG